MARIISLLVLLGLSQLAQAEQGCPDGLYPGGAAPGQICIPMPGYGINGNSGGEVQGAEPRWATRWGAVAVGEDSKGSGILGKAESFPSKRKAEKAALANCEAKDGHDCEITHAYYDQCVAVAWGDTLVSTASAENSEKASQLAVEKCGKSSTNCGIYYTGCSYPERVQ
ncbi:DUF4189 domain-containing protein [Lysobacter sp. Root690]|uniref:DUF4189 domain-containing protein n=1 Tax=Lysobacter sp. Root690 TaxID=1736588 RepID=UPI0009EBD30F|nr:DUF4189 domain-containing protein [Lysobacter sp. Root690]